MKQSLGKEFEMKDLCEFKFCLGVNILQQEDGVYLDQENYVVEILDQFDMKDCKPFLTPIETRQNLLKQKLLENNK